MSFFRRADSYNFRQYSPDNNKTTSNILHTIDHLSLLRDEVILIGSAALALYGVTLHAEHSFDEKGFRPRSGDVDFASTSAYALHLAQHGTSTGLRGQLKQNLTGPNILRIETPVLPADIIPFDKNISSNADQRLRERIERHSVEIDGTDVRVATPKRLARKLRSVPRLDKKAATDLAMLQQRFPGV